jgi:hypothetical protein
MRPNVNRLVVKSVVTWMIPLAAFAAPAGCEVVSRDKLTPVIEHNHSSHAKTGESLQCT